MEYFARPRRATLAPQAPQTQEDASPIQSPSQTEAHSIYVFPTAPSTPPSPSSGSQNARSHIILPRRPRDESLGSSLARSSDLSWDEVNSPLGLLSGASSSGTGEQLGVEPWEWSAEEGADEDESVLEEEIVRASRWDLVSARHGRPLDPGVGAEAKPLMENALRRHQSLYRVRTYSAASSYAPHPRIHLPLLSFFASMLSIDESTLHLISHTPSHSILFVSAPSSSNEAPVSVENERPHGVMALLTTPDEHESLKEGLRVACDSSISSPRSFEAFPLFGLFDLVKGVWIGGGKALRDVWQ